MKINNVTLPGQVQKPEQNKTAEKTTDAPAGAPASPSAEAHLSQAAQDGSKDVDLARVQELRQAIVDGRLEINSEKIADGLIASVRNMLNEES